MKKQTGRRVAALLLAVLMLSSLAFPAFAENSPVLTPPPTEQPAVAESAVSDENAAAEEEATPEESVVPNETAAPSADATEEEPAAPEAEVPVSQAPSAPVQQAPAPVPAGYITLDRSKMTASAESEAADLPAANAIDGNAETIWHCRYDEAGAVYPGAFVLELDKSYEIGQLTITSHKDVWSEASTALPIPAPWWCRWAALPLPRWI